MPFPDPSEAIAEFLRVHPAYTRDVVYGAAADRPRRPRFLTPRAMLRFYTWAQTHQRLTGAVTQLGYALAQRWEETLAMQACGQVPGTADCWEMACLLVAPDLWLAAEASG